LIYRCMGNLRAIRLLLGHTKIESTLRHLDIDVDDPLAIAEQVDAELPRLNGPNGHVSVQWKRGRDDLFAQ
jgi:hypothetical protein